VFSLSIKAVDQGGYCTDSLAIHSFYIKSPKTTICSNSSNPNLSLSYQVLSVYQICKPTIAHFSACSLSFAVVVVQLVV